MKRRTLWKVAVATTLEAEEAVTELLAAVFEATPSAYANARTGRVTIAVYCESRPAKLSASRTALRQGLRRIRQCGLKLGAGRISLRRIKREDWAESWKKHFRPMRIGRRLLVKPSWSRQKPAPGELVIVLDPGLSFGTGHHATTSFCLREIVRRRRAGAAQSFLDIGTGSGILAIAAARLGYGPIRAFDFDPEAVRVARANLRANGVAGKVVITRDDVARLPLRPARRYDLICANLISNLLLAQRRKIIRQLRPGGILVLAGILRSEFPEVQKTFESLGLQRFAGRGEREWYSGSFRRKTH